MTTAHPERIAIIGGGFSGVMTAVNLAFALFRPGGNSTLAPSA
jgi:cation diffusion facilitator CzcD-associated flavoprotein CzcO